MGITLLTKEIKPKNIFYRNEVQGEGRMNYLPMKNVYSGVTELSFQSEGERLLDELHEGHPGMARMKAMARMYVWWPGILKRQ